ncbi:MAG: site-2 protease family protein [Myxococcota bacterium]
MFGSIKLFSVRGIPIRAHFTVLLTIVLIASELGAWGIPASLLLLISLTLHELGHALTGQHFGLRTRAIELHMLGGTAFLEDQPKRPRDELLIALAGPAVSFVLGGIGALSLWLLGASVSFGSGSWVGVLGFFTAVNVWMGLFNLIPALPMDGGRVLRAALALKIGALPATRIAVNIARVIAVGFVIAGLAGSAWTLPLLGVLVYTSAGAELRMAEAMEMRRQYEAMLRAHGFGVGPPGGAFGGYAREKPVGSAVIDVTPGQPVRIIGE